MVHSGIADVHASGHAKAEELRLYHSLVRPFEALRQGATDVEGLQQRIRRTAGCFVSERTRRRPMIVPVVMEI